MQNKYWKEAKKDMQTNLKTFRNLTTTMKSTKSRNSSECKKCKPMQEILEI